MAGMVRLASMKLGLRERGEEWTRELHNETIDRLDERGIDHDYHQHEYVPVVPIRTPLEKLQKSDLTKENVRERVLQHLTRAFRSDRRILLDAPMSSGKSTGTIKAAAKTDTKLFMVMPRGRIEGYDYIEDLCNEHGLTSEVLPTSHEMCDTLQGEYGEAVEQRMRDLQSHGITLRECHILKDWPCGDDCLSWDHIDEDVDVLIGHYTHLNARFLTEGRVVVTDEFPESFDSTYNDPESITEYLQQHDELEFENYGDLLGNRDELERTISSLVWLEKQEMRDAKLALDGIHARTPAMVYTLLEATMELDNERGGFERTALPNGDVGLYNPENGNISILSPPDLSWARGVVGLDGTPNQLKWEAALGTKLEHIEVLNEEEWREFLTHTMGYRFIVTTKWTKPYNSVSNMNIHEDRALIKGIHEQFGKPVVFTTKKVQSEYELDDDLMQHVRDIDHYGNIKSSNKYGEIHIAIVIGGNNPGDYPILKWAAFCDVEAHRPDRSKPENRGKGLSYGEEGDQFYRNKVHDETLQAAMRVNRDGEGGIVIIHTNTLPEKVPATHVPGIVKTRSAGMREVIDVTKKMDGWTTAEVAKWTSCTERTVFGHLNKLHERGKVLKSKNPDDGRGKVWTRVEDINEDGMVDFDQIEFNWKIDEV